MQFLEHPSHGQAQALSPTAAATPTENRSSRRGAPSLQRSGWVKRSPDDLSQLYNNFEEVVRQLSPPECSALRNQLQDKRSTVFRRDTLQREDHSALQDLIRCNYILFS